MWDIAKVLEHYGGYVVPDGTNRPVRCPFHDDRTASGSVDTYKGVFNCHACGMAGNALTLIMREEGCDYETAERRAAEITGESDSQVSGRPRPQRERSLLPQWARDRHGDGGTLPPWVRR